MSSCLDIGGHPPIAARSLPSPHLARPMSAQSPDTVPRSTGARRLGRFSQRRCQCGIIRQRMRCIQVSLCLCPRPVLAHCRARQAQIPGNTSLTLASAQTIDQFLQVIYVYSLHVGCSPDSTFELSLWRNDATFVFFAQSVAYIGRLRVAYTGRLRISPL